MRFLSAPIAGILMAILLLAGMPSPGQAELSSADKKQVETLIENFIRENPVLLRDALTRLAEAEAEAARLLNAAHGRDLEFYTFWQSMQAYRESVALQDNALILSTSSCSRFVFRFGGGGRRGVAGGVSVMASLKLLKVGDDCPG